jgi:exosome complex component RRP40
MNGRVWVNATEVRQTIAVARCIEAVDPDGGGLEEASLKQFYHTLQI